LLRHSPEAGWRYCFIEADDDFDAIAHVNHDSSTFTKSRITFSIYSGLHVLPTAPEGRPVRTAPASLADAVLQGIAISVRFAIAACGHAFSGKFFASAKIDLNA